MVHIREKERRSLQNTCWSPMQRSTNLHKGPRSTEKVSFVCKILTDFSGIYACGTSCKVLCTEMGKLNWITTLYFVLLPSYGVNHYSLLSLSHSDPNLFNRCRHFKVSDNVSKWQKKWWNNGSWQFCAQSWLPTVARCSQKGEEKSSGLYEHIRTINALHCGCISTYLAI